MIAGRPVDALLVIDMQNSFCSPGGAMFERHGLPLVDIDKVVACTAALIDAARAAHAPVVFARNQYQPGYADFGPRLPRYQDYLIQRQGLLAGSWDAAVIGELKMRPDDLVVDKPRPDAFFGTSLDLLLRSMGVVRLAVAGILTNACVESTVRAAAVRDYAVTVLSDCTTCRDATDRERSLACLARYGIAEVRPWSPDLFLC